MEGGSVPVSAPSAGESAQSGENQQGAEPNAQSSAPDDPEIELDDGVKLKKSELRDLHKRRKELDRGAFEKFQKASQIEKESKARVQQAEQIIQALSKDAKAALRAAGIDPYQFAEQTLQEALSEYQLSPAEKEAREYKKRLAEYERQEAERKQKEQSQQYEQEVGKWESTFGDDFVEAFQTSGLPADPFLVQQMAFEVEALMDAGIPYSKNLLREVAGYLDQKYNGSVQKLVQSDKDDLFERLLGDSGLEKARKLILRKAQASAPKPTAPSAPAPKKSGKGLTRAEFEARVSKRIGATK